MYVFLNRHVDQMRVRFKRMEKQLPEIVRHVRALRLHSS